MSGIDAVFELFKGPHGGLYILAGILLVLLVAVIVRAAFKKALGLILGGLGGTGILSRMLWDGGSRKLSDAPDLDLDKLFKYVIAAIAVFLAINIVFWLAKRLKESGGGTAKAGVRVEPQVSNGSMVLREPEVATSDTRSSMEQPYNETQRRVPTDVVEDDLGPEFR